MHTRKKKLRHTHSHKKRSKRRIRRPSSSTTGLPLLPGECRRTGSPRGRRRRSGTPQSWTEGSAANRYFVQIFWETATRMCRSQSPLQTCSYASPPPYQKVVPSSPRSKQSLRLHSKLLVKKGRKNMLQGLRMVKLVVVAMGIYSAVQVMCKNSWHF